MATERNFFEHDVCSECEDDLKWKSMLAASTAVADNENGSFECNICLDAARDPVVTLCGHLYCWPCIYKWLHVQSSSSDVDQQQPNCPVCKASISSSSVVPLYGRGKSSSEPESKRASREVIPPRPLHSPTNAMIGNTSHQNQLHTNFFPSQSRSYHQYFADPHGGYTAMTSSSLGSTSMTSIVSPVIGMVGEQVFARIFGTPETGLFAYPYLNSTNFPGSYPPRMRRQEMQLDKSLNRVSIFLLCCIILCLLLF